MKKLFFLFGLFLTAAVTNAQHMSAGLTLGSGTCWMSNTGQNVVHKESCNIGGTFVYSTDAHWGFAVDIKYSREGYKYTYDGSGPYNGQTLDTRISSDFIRVPIRAIYFFNTYGKSIRPKISLGPSFGFLTGGKIRNEDEGKNIISKGNVNDYFKGFDLGVQATAGINFRLAEEVWLNTDIAYYAGFLKQNMNGSDKMTNNNLVLNLGLTFGIGGK